MRYSYINNISEIMHKNYRLIPFIILLFINSTFAQDAEIDKPKLSPTIKSVILPGWGQYDLEKPIRGNFYLTTEILGIALTTFSIIQSNNNEDTFIAIASEHAEVDVDGKNHQYWVDIGNYDSIDDYNDEHLRWREYDSLYPDENKWNWNWNSKDNRKEFEDIRIKSDKLELYGKFFIGGIVLNHIVSAIDAFYLKNVSLKDKVEILSFYNPETQTLQYSLQFNL